MSIQFACPNGHKLSCPDDRAGTAAKCPKCGEAVQVPQPERGGAADSVTFTSAGESAEADDGMIVFLCPNGHKLNGPKSMQGKAGKCPHCGEKFRIPSDDEQQEELEELPDDSFSPIEEDPAPAEEPIAFPGPGVDEFPASDGVEEFQIAEEEPDDDLVGSGEFSGSSLSQQLRPPLPGAATGGGTPEPHPLLDIVKRLWEEKEVGSSFHLDLGEGETYSPEWFSPELSRGSHGLFASQADDESYTVTAIQWESVRRAWLERLPELPSQWFE